MMPKAKPLPSIERLTELCSYNQKTGIITWKKNERKRRAGAVVGSKNKCGYLVCSIDGSLFYVHRIAWALSVGSIDSDLQVDHINGDRSDNRLCNLRACDNAQNNWNKLGKPYKGASLDKRDGRWSASITVRGRSVSLGRFSTQELAHMAYCKAAAELHGEFARAA
jgi:hypothetical protein